MPNLRLFTSGIMMGRYIEATNLRVFSSRFSAFFKAPSFGRIRTANHGVKINAATSEKNMADAPITGIGRIYGPIMPLTQPMGSRAAIMVKVARIVGLPTSRTASTASASVVRPLFNQCRKIFSTTTVASSTRIPMEKISANILTRSMV